jgi:methionine-rich copper-binding protein CopC
MLNRFMVHLALASALVSSASRAAEAHALLDHASPGVASTVVEPPSEIRLWFTEEIETVFSSVTVTNAAGDRPIIREVQRAGAETLRGNIAKAFPSVC